MMKEEGGVDMIRGRQPMIDKGERTAGEISPASPVPTPKVIVSMDQVERN
jgi:hypothetical protein